MEVDQSIKLRFAYTLQDMIRAHRAHYRQSRRALTDKFLALFLVVIGYCHISPYLAAGLNLQTFLSSLPDSLFPLFWFVAAVVIWFDLASLFGLWRGFRERKSSGDVSIYNFTFDEEGAQFQQGTKMEVKLGWSEVIGLRESKDVLLLIPKYAPDNYWALPKRYFADDVEISHFRNLANRKLALNLKSANP